jgi:anti-anti-sigma factor
MSAPDQSGDMLLVAMQGDYALVRVVGRGSFKVSTNLKQFGMAAIEADCRIMVLDMEHCIGMDSTFMGVLAGLAFRLQQQADGSLLLVNLNERTLHMITTLGLDQVVEPYLVGQTPKAYEQMLAPPTGLESLDGGAENRQTTAETVLEAHETLANLTPENAPKFKDVLVFLREDLQRAADSRQAGESKPKA